MAFNCKGVLCPAPPPPLHPVIDRLSQWPLFDYPPAHPVSEQWPALWVQTTERICPQLATSVRVPCLILLNYSNQRAPRASSTISSIGNSHRIKSAACPKFDMVWLNRSPIPVGRRGVISSLKFFLPAFAVLIGRGVGVGTLWYLHPSVIGQVRD